ncbi:hypothetical protein HPB48_000398 [Haemaphysalis longicornis]|uniref:POLO box domain-containing protein n=1 Tax=Haemaphysalis longicornis TaxID=44386 RepID=A0A9J6GD23_HAELO|nr:hypothetical protein HPB48_000398 [Haemaphysalis longicornis]
METQDSRRHVCPNYDRHSPQIHGTLAHPNSISFGCITTNYASYFRAFEENGKWLVLLPRAVGDHAALPVATNASTQHKGSQGDAHLSELECLLQLLSGAKAPQRRFTAAEEAEDPASVPAVWVSKWVGCTEKCGMGHKLCGNSIGVMYNDNTRMMPLSNSM